MGEASKLERELLSIAKQYHAQKIRIGHVGADPLTLHAFRSALASIRDSVQNILAMFPADYNPHRDIGSVDTTRHECREILALLSPTTAETEKLRCPLCSHSRDEHNDKGCTAKDCRCQKQRERI